MRWGGRSSAVVYAGDDCGGEPLLALPDRCARRQYRHAHEGVQVRSQKGSSSLSGQCVSR